MQTLQLEHCCQLQPIFGRTCGKCIVTTSRCLDICAGSSCCLFVCAEFLAECHLLVADRAGLHYTNHTQRGECMRHVALGSVTLSAQEKTSMWVDIAQSSKAAGHPQALTSVHVHLLQYALGDLCRIQHKLCHTVLASTTDSKHATTSEDVLDKQNRCHQWSCLTLLPASHWSMHSSW